MLRLGGHLKMALTPADNPSPKTTPIAPPTALKTTA